MNTNPVNDVTTYTVATMPVVPTFQARRNNMPTMAPVQSSGGEILVTASQLFDRKGVVADIIPARPLLSADTWPSNARI